MKKIVPILASAALAFSAVPASASDEPSAWKTVGDWDVSFYPTLPGCMALILYESGLFFFIGVSTGEQGQLLELTLMNEAWESIEDGKDYEILVQFGRETPWTLEMAGLENEGMPMLTYSFPLFSSPAKAFINEFMRKNWMEWSYLGSSLGNLSLRGSRAAFLEMVNCQREFNKALASTGDPFAPRSGSPDDPFSR